LAEASNFVLPGRGLFREERWIQKSPSKVLKVIYAIEHDGNQVAGVAPHQIPQDLEPLLLPTDMEADPVLILLLRQGLNGFLFQVQVPCDFFGVKPW
jgi:hypothetical protein